jgi:hypothetical protein
LEDAVVSVQDRDAGICSGVEEDYPFVDSFEAYRQVEFCFDLMAQVMIFLV